MPELGHIAVAGYPAVEEEHFEQLHEWEKETHTMAAS